MQKLDLVREKLHETNEEFEKARVKTKKAKQAFERVKKERFDLFMSCFEHFSNEIDGIYKVCSSWKTIERSSLLFMCICVMFSRWPRTSLPKPF